MKKFLFLCLMIASLGFASFADAISFEPVPADMNDLDHFYYYTWGIDWTPDKDISSAQFIFHDMMNHNSAPNVLYVHLLDSAPSGLVEFYDNQGGGDNFADFAGEDIFLFKLENANWPPRDRIYTFTEDQIDILMQYASDGNFGFGVDPDCHYYNNGVEFKANLVPEPGTLMLLGSGLTGLGFYARRRKN